MNSKKQVKIIDTNFAHAKYSTDFQESKYIDWYRNNEPSDVTFMTDNSLYGVDNVKGTKIGWLMEPRAIFPRNYEWMRDNHHRFDTVLTYDKSLLSISDNIKFSPHCGCWIKAEDQQVYQKSKLLSIVASGKRQTTGHKLRHEAIKLSKDNGIPLDVYGRGYNPVQYKLTTLKDYAFSVVIENSKSDYYFTEKLMDSFVTGTVPIYWGCPSIGDFFNTDGMIIIDDANTLLSKLESLSLEGYKSMLPAIEDNFNRAKEFLIAEDWIYKNIKIVGL